METLPYLGAAIMGGVVNFPVYSFLDTPQLVVTEQINTVGNATNSITLAGSVVTQVFGNFIGGVNRNYPGTNQI